MKNTISQLLLDAHKGFIPTEYASVSPKERDEAIRGELFKVLGIESYDKKSFRKAWRKNRNAVYEIMEEVVDQVLLNGEAQKDAFFNQFVEVKANDLGDTNEFYAEGHNELEFVEFSGSHFDLKRRRIDAGQKFPTEVRDYGLAVFEFFERVASGRTDMAKLIGLVADAAEKKLATIAQATFAKALTNLPSQLKVSGSYAESDILDMLSRVEGANGSKPVLVGTRAALAKLQGIASLPASDGMKNEYNNQGYLSVWKGYSCVEIAQGIKLGTLEFTMENNKIYALTGGDKLVKLFLEGDTEVKEVSDGTTNADRTMENDTTIKVGCAVCYNKLIGSITLA